MQDQNPPSDPFQVVWPVGPTEQPIRPQGEPTPETTETPVLLPVDVLLRHRGRMLDPATALQPGKPRRSRDNQRLRNPAETASIRYFPTAYVADELLVRTAGRNRDGLNTVTEDLQRALNESPLGRTRTLRLEPADERQLDLIDDRLATESPGVLRLAVRSDSDTSEAPPDAWDVLQVLLDDQPGRGTEIGLNHLMFAAGVGGVGFSVGHSAGGVGFSVGHSAGGVGFSVGHGTAEYALPGLGGRAPVRWLARPPARQQLTGRRPVVAIVDTGVAKHPWFDADPADPVVTRLRYNAKLRDVESATITTGGEADPNLIDPLEGLIDPFFGHGTFIAGLIRQVCPDADIVSIKVMGTDGIVEEADLINTIGALHQRQVGARAAPAEPGIPGLIDVLSLSLGYYHEAGAAGDAYDGVLRSAIEALGQVGILVVASAGNNASSQPLLPAGFTTFKDGKLPVATGRLPLISVGALNPDGSVALFSNSGSWVACHSPGAALVSTLPMVDSAQRSGVDTGFAPPAERPVASWRATIDPDNFTGFGTWSGTSFAAPVAAAAVAQALVDKGTLAKTRAESTARLRDALEALDFTLVVS